MTRSEKVEVRVSAGEKAVLERAARASGCSVSEYVRAACAGFAADVVVKEFRVAARSGKSFRPDFKRQP